MPIKTLLETKRIQLTQAQKLVARYIMDHYEDSIFMTAAELARKARVSEATIVRFAQALGFDGYPKLQQLLRTKFQDRLTMATRLEQAVKNTRTDGDNLSRIIQEDMRNLSETLRDISPEVFHQAVADMKNAKQIYVVGLRGSHGPALVLALHLSYLGMQALPVVPGYGDVWSTLYGMGAEDLAIGIGFPRYTKLTIDVLEYAKESGARVGAITDSIVSPLASHADWVLPVHCKLDSFNVSFTAAMSLINALLTELSLQNPEVVMKGLKRRELTWQKNEVYIRPYAASLNERKMHKARNKK